MKTSSGLSFWLPLASLTAAFVFLPRIIADDTPRPDTAARLLAERGFVRVEAAGPHVVRGTFRIQVLVKFGRPDAMLSNDTWLYQERDVESSGARGTLVVQFTNGRVSDLAVVTPAVVAALRAEPHRPLNATLVAASSR